MFEISYKSFGYKMYYLNNCSYSAAIVKLFRYIEHLLTKSYSPDRILKYFSDKLTVLNRVYFSVSLILTSILKKNYPWRNIPLKEKKKKPKHQKADRLYPPQKKKKKSNDQVHNCVIWKNKWLAINQKAKTSNCTHHIDSLMSVTTIACNSILEEQWTSFPSWPAQFKLAHIEEFSERLNKIVQAFTVFSL